MCKYYNTGVVESSQSTVHSRQSQIETGNESVASDGWRVASKRENGLRLSLRHELEFGTGSSGGTAGGPIKSGEPRRIMCAEQGNW
jgi:hypothetical protein